MTMSADKFRLFLAVFLVAVAAMGFWMFQKQGRFVPADNNGVLDTVTGRICYPANGPSSCF
jgi:hypothetical protein